MLILISGKYYKMRRFNDEIAKREISPTGSHEITSSHEGIFAQ